MAEKNQGNEKEETTAKTEGIVIPLNDYLEEYAPNFSKILKGYPVDVAKQNVVCGLYKHIVKLIQNCIQRKAPSSVVYEKCKWWHKPIHVKNESNCLMRNSRN